MLPKSTRPLLLAIPFCLVLLALGQNRPELPPETTSAVVPRPPEHALLAQSSASPEPSPLPTNPSQPPSASADSAPAADSAPTADSAPAADSAPTADSAPARSDTPALPQGERAYRYLERLCAIGPRVSGSEGMEKQQLLLAEHFARLGGIVQKQAFLVRNPLGGPKVRMTNLIVHWHPDRRDRVLLCAHYDTRPFPDRDPDPLRRQQPIFVGANDGASGTALLMELGHLMPGLERSIGVDFVLFDGEELVYDDRRDPYFLGSQWFARQYRAEKPSYRYQWGILLDMIADADQQLYYEHNSVTWPDTRPLVHEIWATAASLGIRTFIPQRKHNVRDDHLALRNIAGIPTCDIIDFDYPYWHTADDVPQRCSAQSLENVGRVLIHWLRSKP